MVELAAVLKMRQVLQRLLEMGSNKTNRKTVIEIYGHNSFRPLSTHLPNNNSSLRLRLDNEEMPRLVDKASRNSLSKCLLKTVALWLQDPTRVKCHHSPLSKWNNAKAKFFKDQTFHLKKVSMHLISQLTSSHKRPKVKNRDKDKSPHKQLFNS